MNTEISFIIPHKGREQMLLQTLDSICQQTLSQDRIEVIVVSQNSEFSDALRAYGSKLNLTLLLNDPANTISHSRNLGAQQANGRFLAFLDADVALSENWAAAMQHILEHRPDTRLASAIQMNSDNATPLEKIRTGLSNAEVDTDVTFLPGRNLFVKRDTFYQVGGFPEHLVTCEDYFFTGKVSALGRLYYSSDATYVHLGEDRAFLPMLSKEIWRGQSNVASLKGRPIPLREWPSFIVPFWVTIGLLSSVTAAFLTQWTITLLLLLIGIAPLAAYTVRLKRLVKQDVSIAHCLIFYSLYFPARAVGTMLGIVAAIGTNSHK